MHARYLIDPLEYAKYSRLVDENPDRRSERVTVSYSDYYNQQRVNPLQIERVVFNPPATIILWADKTKTVVKCQGGEPFDPEKGMTMAFMKKVYGNTGGYFKEVEKWCKPYYEKEASENYPELASLTKIAETVKYTKEDLQCVNKKLQYLRQIVDKIVLNKSESGDENDI